jgi:hypothetical protein
MDPIVRRLKENRMNSITKEITRTDQISSMYYTNVEKKEH